MLSRLERIFRYTELLGEGLLITMNINCSVKYLAKSYKGCEWVYINPIHFL